jgi:hypothetical protein
LLHAAARTGHRLRPSALIVALVGMLIAFASLTVAPRSAEAYTCPMGHFCMWEHVGFSGGVYSAYGSDDYLGNNLFSNGVAVDNHASSVQNNGWVGPYDDVIVYDYARPLQWASASACIPVGYAYRDVFALRGSNPGNWNDRISSYKWVNSC